ncbi:hypothetical protein NE237_000159 [Protea cynaroides]|uniref:Uncharacterized protein n=1 Tax=Protea cynaroides TaxID=273540 RepID=A0A9Q0GM99_9MAGN|nr:hypothetical protein NE237_000159 [Protea cynaroides]
MAGQHWCSMNRMARQQPRPRYVSPSRKKDDLPSTSSELVQRVPVEEYSQMSPDLGILADKDDGKYISGLSTKSVGKTKEVDEFQEHIRHGIEELKWIKSFGEKASQMVNSEQHLNEHQINMLLSTMKSVKEKVFELQYKLEYKTQEADEGKEKQADLLKMLESSYTVGLMMDRRLQGLWSNKELLLSKIESLNKNIF